MFLPAFYDVGREKESYSWEAQQLKVQDAESEDLKQAFLKLVTGVKDLTDIKRKHARRLVPEDMTRRIDENLALRKNKIALASADHSTRQVAAWSCRTFSSLERLFTLNAEGAVEGPYIVTEPRLGLARAQPEGSALPTARENTETASAQALIPRSLNPMPGLVGFLQEDGPEAGARRLERMARALEPEDRFHRELHTEPGVGIGRVTLGILNPDPQPIWNQDRSVGVVMEGELFDTDRLRRGLVERRRPSLGSGDGDLILQLYLEYGNGFAAMLNGAFLIAIWDRRSRKLALATDRLGLHPVYFAPVKGGVVFASGVRALLGEPGLRREIDRTAIAEFLTFDHALLQRTLLSDVQLLPQGSVLTVRSGNARIRQYWRPTFLRAYPVRKDVEYSDELVELLRQAVRRQRRDPRPVAVLLSGGLDSRTVLAAMAGEPGGPLSAITWGIPGCDDQRYARESARLAGIPHRSIPLRPDWLLHLARKGVRITDGLGNLLNLHALAVAEPAGEQAPILYKGFLGDAMFGFSMRPRLWAEYDDTTRVHAHLEVLRDIGCITFDLPEHARLFTPAFRRAIGDEIVEDYRSAIEAAESPQLSDQRLYIDLTQRIPRMTIYGVEGVRDQAAVRLPFTDNDLLDFSLQVPPGLRYGRQVMIQGFIRAFPAYAQIPFTPSGLPLMACARDVFRRGTFWAQWHLRRVGLGWLAGPTTRPTKDYARWLRAVLRGWVEETLLSPASLDRGYFQPDEIRRLVAEHMAGVDHAVRLGALLSLEMWHREFLD